MVIGAFHCAHVVESIPWLLAQEWTYWCIYVPACFFSAGVGSVLSYSLFHFCLPTGY